MKLAKGLEVLNMPNPFNPLDIIYLTLLYDKNDVILFDTGYPGNYKNIKIGFMNASLSIDKLTKVIITNQDFDHIGGLYDIKKENVEIYTHEDNKPYIEGKIKPLKMTEEYMNKIIRCTDQFTKTRQDEIINIINNLYVHIDKTVTDNEELPICGGINVIKTKGPTPGHCSFYLKKYKTLIASDILNIYQGELYGPDRNNTSDITQAVNSLKQFLNYDIQKVICYHNGVYEKNVNKRMKKLFEDELNELK